MEEANKRLALRWFTEVWNERFPGAIDELFHPDGVIHSHEASGWSVAGLDKLRVFFQRYLEAFPDLRIEVQEMVAEDDKVAVRCRVTATHLGDGLGLQATGNRVEITGMSILRFLEGQVAEVWSNFDVEGLYRQIGTVSRPARSA
ncbi:MAG TPA: ester cyclase [bacterium]|nr:ester cyclase [bacterium]